jgi:hypothetical protein
MHSPEDGAELDGDEIEGRTGGQTDRQTVSTDCASHTALSLSPFIGARLSSTRTGTKLASRQQAVRYAAAEHSATLTYVCMHACSRARVSVCARTHARVCALVRE